MESFELDITHYSIEELFSLLRLDCKNEDDLNEKTIKLNVSEIRKQLLYTRELDRDKCNEIIEFYHSIEDKLVRYVQKLNSDKHAVEQYNKRRHEYEYKKREIEEPAPNVNSIYKRSITRLISIDTLFRKNYKKTKSTEFTYQMDPPLKNVTSIRLSAVEIPNIWRMFTSQNGTNTFKIKVHNYPLTLEDAQSLNCKLLTQEYTITVPEGNYTTEEFVTTLNKIFYNYDEVYPNIPNVQKVTGLKFLMFRINDLTGQTVLSTVHPDEPNMGVDRRKYSYDKLQPSFAYDIIFSEDQKITRMYNTTGWFLGFRNPSYHVKMNSILKTDYPDDSFPTTFEIIQRPASISSEGIYGSNFNNYVYLCIDDYNNNHYESVITNREFKNDSLIFARITVNTEFNTVVYNNANDQIYKKREYFGPVKLDKMSISLRDRFGNILDIHENDFSFAIECQQEYS